MTRPTTATNDTPGEYRRLGGPVRPDDVGERVDYYLAREFPFLSRSGWQARLAEGKLLVNGRGVKSSTKLKLGDALSLHSPLVAEPEVDRGVKRLWERDGVMAIFKPGNLPMHENGPYRKNTFTEIVWQTFGREWSAVHRLDRETSGIVLCGATAEIRARLAIELEGRRMRKEYLAIARGVPVEEAWTNAGAIGDLTESAIRIKKWVVPDDVGLDAATQFSVLATGGDACLLSAKPLTGRTNQIRIHSAHSGHVLFGDKLYHPNEEVFLEYFENGATPWVVEQTGFHRLCLHAAALEFTHPVDKVRERVEAPLPPDMAAFWTELAGARDVVIRPHGAGDADEAIQAVQVGAQGCQQTIRA